MRFTDAQTRPKITEQLYRKTLSHDVSELMRRRYMENLYFAKSHLLSDEVNVDLNMFGPAMMSRVSCHIYSANVVTGDNCSRL